jgi:hypothetical protein
MSEDSFTGKELEEALGKDEFAHHGLEIFGMVKSSDEEGHISFTMSGCEDWADIPTDLIKHAQKIGSSRCKDHSHPVFILTLKEQQTPEGRALSALLEQRVSMQHAASTAAGGRPDTSPGTNPGIRAIGPLGGQLGPHVRPTNVAYWPNPDGSWQCVGFRDCVNMINEVGCSQIQCYTGWVTGEVTCICTN